VECDWRDLEVRKLKECSSKRVSWREELNMDQIISKKGLKKEIFQLIYNFVWDTLNNRVQFGSILVWI